MSKKKEILLHILAWILYYINSTITYPSYSVENFGFWNIAFKQLTGVIIMAIVFYTNYGLLLPMFLNRKKYVYYGISSVVLIGIGVALYYGRAFVLDSYFYTDKFFYGEFMRSIPYTATQVFFYILISTGYSFARVWFKYIKLSREYEKERLASELAQLQYQINPHFLYNTMHNINYLVHTNSQRASDALVMLSRIMRHMFRRGGEDTIPLSEELDYIRSFVELQKLRVDKPDAVRFDVYGTSEGLHIHPMIMIPFIENAFKHGNINGSTGINIMIIISDNRIDLSVSNMIAQRVRKDKTSGVGLENVKRRLAIVYPEKHILDAGQKNSNQYNVELSIELNEN